jgi:hypothetical protein
MNPTYAKNRINSNLIQRYGVDVVKERIEKTQNSFGELVDSTTTSGAIRIVINGDDDDYQKPMVKNLAEKNSEYIYFYCLGDIDIKIDDLITYPVNSNVKWIVDFIDTFTINDTPVAHEVRAYKKDW